MKAKGAVFHLCAVCFCFSIFCKTQFAFGAFGNDRAKLKREKLNLSFIIIQAELPSVVTIRVGVSSVTCYVNDLTVSLFTLNILFLVKPKICTIFGCPIAICFSKNECLSKFRVVCTTCAVISTLNKS